MYEKKLICLISVFLYGCISQVHMDNSLCGVDVESMVSKGVGLQHHQFWSAKTADVVECARICVKRKLCQSFNFDTDTRQCELNNESYSTGKDVRSDENLVYSSIAQWPSQIEPNCFARPCGIDEICIPGHLLGNAGCSYTCLKMAFSVPTPTVASMTTSNTRMPVSTSNSSPAATDTPSTTASPVSTSIPSSAVTDAPSTTSPASSVSTSISSTAATDAPSTSSPASPAPTPTPSSSATDAPLKTMDTVIPVDFDWFPTASVTTTQSTDVQSDGVTTSPKPSSLTGQAFYTVFPKAGTVSDEADVARLIFIKSSKSTSVHFRSVILSAVRNVEVDGFSVQNFSVEFKHTPGEEISSKAILITSNEPINVHTMVMKNSTAEIACDSFYVLPEDRLAREYIIVTTEMTPQFFVVGTEGETTVEINLVNNKASVSVSLGRYDVYTFERNKNGDLDLTGSIITSDKDVAVISGGFYASIPWNAPLRNYDTSIVQMIGVTDWLKTCILAPFQPLNKFEFKIVASENDTEIDVITDNMTTTVSLNRSEKFQRVQSEGSAIFVRATKPIMAVMFLVSSMIKDTDNGASSMVQCQYIERYLNYYTFFVPAIFQSFVRIIIQQEYVADLRLNSMEIHPTDWLNITTPRGTVYTIIYYKVKAETENTLETTSGVRFGADLHGYDKQTQYSHKIGDFYV